MSYPCAPGWNDPPSLTLGSTDGTSMASGTRRPRARVFHSVDGIGAVSTNTASNQLRPDMIGPPSAVVPGGPPLPPVIPQGPVHPPQGFQLACSGIPQVPMQPYCQQQRPPTVAQALPSMGYDNSGAPASSVSATVTRLVAQVNRVLGDASLEILGKDAIAASIATLQTDLSFNRLSAGASELVKQFISFLELRDFKRAEDTLNVIKQQSEAANWALALHHLMYYSHLQASRH